MPPPQPPIRQRHITATEARQGLEMYRLQQRGATRPSSARPVLKHAMTAEELHAMAAKAKNEQRIAALRAGSDPVALMQLLRSRGPLAPDHEALYQSAVARRAARATTLYNRQVESYLGRRRHVAEALKQGHRRTDPAMVPLLAEQHSLYSSLMRMKPRGASPPPAPL